LSRTKDYEIIFVDDGSTDSSFELIRKLQDQDPRILAVQLTRNFGQHPAIAAGLSQATGEVVVIMDADLQNPPEEIPRLLSGIDQGFDLVFGVRKQRKDNLFRRVGSVFAELILKALIGPQGNVSAFLAVRRQFVEAFNACPERNKFFTGLFTWLGAKSMNVEVEHSARYAGKTHYSARKLAQMLIVMTVSFSEYPLRLMSWTGFVVSMAGLLLAARAVVQKLFLQVAVPGYASLFAAIVFFGGVQLLFLGVIGEYLARVHIETRRRPDYLIRTVRGKAAEND
jgi:dolichol-phosphate mannosyltransferase